MNRIDGMPIRVKGNYTIEDNRWIGDKIEQFKEFDLQSQYELDWLLKEHPGCVYEIEMTEQDWIELAVKKALRCKKTIDRLEKSPIEEIKFYNINGINMINFEDGDIFGDLPKVYRKVCRLEKEVMDFEKRSPKFDVVPDMPIRVVTTKMINDDNFTDKKILPGTILNLDSDYFEYFREKHPESFQEIKMTEEDWIELLNNDAREYSEKIRLLENVSGKKFNSHFKDSFSPIYPEFYGGGLLDAYKHLNNFKRDLDKFEKEVYQDLNSRELKTDDYYEERE